MRMALILPLPSDLRTAVELMLVVRLPLPPIPTWTSCLVKALTFDLYCCHYFASEFDLNTWWRPFFPNPKLAGFPQLLPLGGIVPFPSLSSIVSRSGYFFRLPPFSISPFPVQIGIPLRLRLSPVTAAEANCSLPTIFARWHLSTTLSPSPKTRFFPLPSPFNKLHLLVPCQHDPLPPLNFFLIVTHHVFPKVGHPSFPRFLFPPFLVTPQVHGFLPLSSLCHCFLKTQAFLVLNAQGRLWSLLPISSIDRYLTKTLFSAPNR